ncbi:MAG: bifunctional glutamate N-acetyltransferase/amino-acid acetyltransferase ArgJ [Acidobacteria bacterium]|nr:bifunctional glutamate N-acetyltransferase/amino-acid acetyltransferase ArgJ [Acidobacteriota bacterium]
MKSVVPPGVTINHVPGGVTAPAGFRVAACASGIKKAGGLDLALIVSDAEASAAGVFTTNKAQAAPVLVSREHLAASGGYASAIIVNSGCANACTGPEGLAVARSSADFVASAIGCRAEQVLVASTGVIGVQLDVDKIRKGAARAAGALSRGAHHEAALAIMTTDREPKETAVRVTTPAGAFHVGGIAKGAGMIEPHMATMLGFVTTDALVDPSVLRRALVDAVEVTFNAISVDGDTSTNDTVFLLASGSSTVVVDDGLYQALVAGLIEVCGTLARAIVRGGEGATKLVSITASGAASPEDAKRAAQVIANSLLVKTAIHGGDPNWGRLVAAAGRAGVAFDIERAQVRVGPIVLFSDGVPYDDRAPEAATYLTGSEIEIEVNLGGGGPFTATVWTCDLSAEYVKINAEYRT